MENFLVAETGSGPMDVYIAAPALEKKLPVMIVFQEAFGVNSHIRDICRRFAKLGFLAAAPELFHRLGRHVELDYSDRKAIMPYMGSLTNEMLMEDLRDTLDLLKKLPNADLSQVHSIGFCLGGFTSLLSATRFQFKACISFYGAGVVRAREGIGLTPFVEELEQIKTPSLLFFGEKDASIPPEDVNEIRVSLSKSPNKSSIQVFPEADHGFFCDERKSYHPEAAREAWSLVKEWVRPLPQDWPKMT